MGDQQIQNPAGAWQAGATWGTGNVPTSAQRLDEYQNNSGASITTAQVVVTDVTGSLATTTTTANDKTTIGVVAQRSAGSTQTLQDTFLAGVPIPVVTQGVARINIGSNTVAVGDILCASGTAGVAVTNNAATVGQAIAIALEASSAKDANNTIRAYIKKM
jgi:hypothetical protein